MDTDNYNSSNMAPLQSWKEGVEKLEGRPKSLGDESVPQSKCWDRFLSSLGFCKRKKIDESSQQKKLRRVMTEQDFFLYELGKKSEVFEIQDTAYLTQLLPSRSIGYPWVLTFSTSIHGFSLHSLYRSMNKIDSPVILAIEDINGRVFGAVLSCALKVSEHFYGSNETFLFRCGPFEAFRWSGNNFYFIQGQESFISVGSDNGNFGLWLDDCLDRGTTDKCSTFNSPPLVEEREFKIKTVECWTSVKI